MRDRSNHTTVRVSTTAAGVQANADVFRFVISDNGQFVAMGSAATNLVAGANTTLQRIYVKDRATGVLSLMSNTWNGAAANGDSFEPALSGDGRYLVYHTAASNIVAGDTNGFNDMIVRDRLTGAIAPVSVTPTGATGNNHSFRPGITRDGRWITFASRATNIVPGKTSTIDDAFIAPNPLW